MGDEILAEGETDSIYVRDLKVNPSSLVKQYRDDIEQLRMRATQALTEGVAHKYLDADGAISLADRMGLEKPRVKTEHRVYFTRIIDYSIGVMAFDDEDAVAQAAKMHARNIRSTNLDYGKMVGDSWFTGLRTEKETDLFASVPKANAEDLDKLAEKADKTKIKHPAYDHQDPV